MWQRTWIPEEGLETLEELPEDFTETVYKTHRSIYCTNPDGSYTFASEYKIACHKKEFRFYHFCPRCNLWIEGQPITGRVDTMDVMCGRKGETKHCRRCGVEFDFSGAVS